MAQTNLMRVIQLGDYGEMGIGQLDQIGDWQFDVQASLSARDMDGRKFLGGSI
jgi:hypothetical protein